MIKYHKLTSLFAKSIPDCAVLVNNHWDHVEILQRCQAKIKNMIPQPQINYYTSYSMSPNNKISNILDYNVPTNFEPLQERNAKAQIFQKGIKLDTSPQAEPDSIIDFREANFIDKRIHGMDQKAVKNSSEFDNRMFSQFTEIQYENSLRHFENYLRTNGQYDSTELEQITIALQKMALYSNNIPKLQIVWAENLHLFTKSGVPPLRISDNFCLTNTTFAFKHDYKQSMKRLQTISDTLKSKKIPENDLKRAFEIIDNSFMTLNDEQIIALLEQNIKF